MTARRVAAIAGVNILLLVAIVVVLELAFGGWVRDDALNRLNLVRDRRIQFSTRHLYPSESGVAVYSRDKYGLRGNCGDPSRITLLTVGGSTTDQRFVSDGDTWQAAMQRRLNDRGKRVCVANAGVDGQSTIGHLKNFEWWFPYVPGLAPKQIVFYVGINDFYTENQTEYDGLVAGQGVRSFRQILREYSALYHVIYTLYGNYQAQITHSAGHGGVDLGSLTWTTDPLRHDHRTLMAAHLQAYKDRLSMLIERAEAIGALPILVTQPSRWHRIRSGVLEGVTETTKYAGVSINGVDRHMLMRLLDEATCAIASDHGVPCIDLGDINFLEDSDFYDFAHMTPSGAQKIGRALADALYPLI